MKNRILFLVPFLCMAHVVFGMDSNGRVVISTRGSGQQKTVSWIKTFQGGVEVVTTKKREVLLSKEVKAPSGVVVRVDGKGNLFSRFGGPEKQIANGIGSLLYQDGWAIAKKKGSLIHEFHIWLGLSE